jgi:hypothetical protein
MASPQDLRVIYEMGFAPLNPVNVPVARMTIELYPKITPLMPVHERVHAFQMNKSALKDLPTNLRLVIDAFGARLNASLTIEGILSDWHQYFQERWMNFAHLTILSFHNSRGDCIDDTTVAGNAQVLMPVQDGALPTCCKQDVHFVQIQCTLDFANLITINPYPVGSVLQVSYYIELPQASRAMVNGAGAGYTLVSFLGANNLCTLAPDVVKTMISTPVLQDGPIMLEASDFNLQNANTNSVMISEEIDGKILKLAWHQLCASIFNELCPGYSNQPQAVLEHIKQLYLDAKGNLVCTPVFAYYQQMMNAMHPFAGEAQFPKSVCNALIDGLDKRLMAILCQNYADHSLLHDLTASYQRSRFPAILQAMQSAEDKVQSISAIACSSVGGQAFHVGIVAFPSQAERTLDCYSGGYQSDGGASDGYRSGGYQSDGGASGGYCSEGGYCSNRLGGPRGDRELGQRDSCFSCKGIHPWMKNGIVVCPNADKPGVRVAAQLAYEVWLKKTKARHENKKRNRGFNFDKLSNANKAKTKEAVLASMKMDAHTSDGTTMASPCKKPMILVANVIVLSLVSGSHNILPAPIVSNFPHIHLQLGTNLGCPNCPVVRCVVNTAAALSTGNFHFITTVAK